MKLTLSSLKSILPFAIGLLGAASVHAGAIGVLEATYGGNCGAYRGNVTYDARRICDGREFCRYPVDVARIGDPAFGCEKTYTVNYLCAADDAIRQQRVREEANGRFAVIDCRPGQRPWRPNF